MKFYFFLLERALKISIYSSSIFHLVLYSNQTIYDVKRFAMHFNILENRVYF